MRSLMISSTAAKSLRTTGASVDVSGAAPPTTGQELLAVDATHAGWFTPGGGSGGTLDDAYDFGGAGSGAVVIVDAGPLLFQGNAADNNNVLEIEKIPAASHSGNGGNVHMGVNAIGHGIHVLHDGSGLSGLFAGTPISVPGVGASSERLGVGSLAAGDESVAFGAGATAPGVHGSAVGRSAHADGDSVAVGWSAFAFGVMSIAVGGRASTFTKDRITHVATPFPHSFVAGHLFWEVNDFYGGGGIQCPETTGRYAQSPPNWLIHGSGGQTWTTILEPFNEGFNGQAFTASATIAGGGTLAGSYLVAIGFTNKERNGETLLTTPFSVNVGGGNNAIIIQNLAAAITVDPQIEEVLIYMEDAPGSGNLYLAAASTGADTTLLVPAPVSIATGYLGYPGGGEIVTGGRVTTPDTSASVVANTTDSAGHGWSVGLAGGDSDDAALPGGDINFLTNRIGAAHTLTMAARISADEGFVAIGANPPVSRLDVQGSVGLKTVNVSGTITLGDAEAYIFDTSGGNGVGNLPDATTCSGRFYDVKKNGAANSLTLTPFGGQTIDRAANLVVTTDLKAFTIRCDGVTWWII